MSSDYPNAKDFRDIIHELLGTDLFKIITSAQAAAPPKKHVSRRWPNTVYDIEMMEAVAGLYCNGAPLANISATLFISEDSIDDMLDIIIPYL